jgi:MYXO-CTERM domain-containing protein
VCAGGVLLCAPGAGASIFDLSQPLSSALINGAYFETVDFPHAGTGVLDSFVRIQRTNTEQGYNTSGRPVPFDEITTANFTHDMKMQDIPVVTVNNVPSLEFWLDINQNSGQTNNLLSLDKIQVYTSAIGSQTTTNIASLGVLRYDLDLGGDNWINMDYELGAGSGHGDVRMYVPLAFFPGAQPGDYLYLYSSFGENLRSNDGFEEWAVQDVPGPGALALLGLAMAFRAPRRR